MGRGVVTDRATCHQMARACGSKNAASTRGGARLMSSACSDSGGGSGAPPGAIGRDMLSQYTAARGRREDGKTGRREDGKTGRREDGKTGRREDAKAQDEKKGRMEERKPDADASWDEHYADERDASWLYRELARVDRNRERADLFARLAVVEDRHTAKWEELFRGAGRPLPSYSVSLRTRILAS